MDTVTEDAPLAGARRASRRWNVEAKLQIVQETLVPGNSVAKVARKYEVNANQVFDWRKLYREGRLGSEGDLATSLLPVEIVPDVKKAPPVVADKLHRQVTGKLRIEAQGVAVTVEGGVDESVLRLLVGLLRQC